MHRLIVDSEDKITPTYAGRCFSHEIPRFRLADEGLAPEAPYQLIHDELNLDGNPALNLASFVTSWMEPAADRLMTETLGKNFIDADEYPQSTEIQHRCVNMLARLWHAP